MLKRRFLIGLFCVLSPTLSLAQDLCPPGVASNKLICVIPQAFGVSQTLNVGSSNSSLFRLETLKDSLQPLNSSVARESALLPLASPSSGITFLWDPAAKISVPSADSLGPILGERADTIGKYKVFLGLSYQSFQFDRLDGVNLKQLPVAITQLDDSQTFGGNPTCSVNGANLDQCGYIRDVITTNTRLDLKVHQITSFFTYGLTDRIDISMAIPIENVRMGAFSTATIVDNSHSNVHSFPIVNGCGSTSGGVIVPCLVNSFTNVRSVSGIGDITFRVKAHAWESENERAGLAIGVDVRTPTGDALNFLGAGTYGVRPFVVWSYRWRIAPHWSVGYQMNGDSLLAGDISTGKKVRLPGALTYSGGADFWLTKWLTGAFDLLGQQVFEAGRTSVTEVVVPGACSDTSGVCNSAQGFAPSQNDPSLSQSTASFNGTSMSVGAKVRPFGSSSSLLITGNALIGLNSSGGLHSKVVPLLGVSYTF